MNESEVHDISTSLTSLMDLGLTLQQINKALEVKFGASIVQWSLLRALLEMPAVSPMVLSRSLRVTPGTLTQTLTRLAKKKYLFMCEDPHDARKKMISLTRLGRDVVQELEAEYETIFSEIGQVKTHIKCIDGFLKNKVQKQLFNTTDLAFVENDMPRPDRKR